MVKSEYKIRLEATSDAGVWYRCDECGYAILLKYYNPTKDVCW